MKEIPLSRGKVAIVDDADYDWLMQWKWSTLQAGYAVRHEPIRDKNGKRLYYPSGGPRAHVVYMHREIMKAPKGMEVDHINRNGFDNRRCNLRLCTRKQNRRNSKGWGKKSKYTGVFPYSGAWVALLVVNGHRHNGGIYTSQMDAARAYDRLALSHYGDFALPNLSDSRDWTASDWDAFDKRTEGERSQALAKMASRRSVASSQRSDRYWSQHRACKYRGCATNGQDRWLVRFRVGDRIHYFGSWKHEVDAARAYDFAARRFKRNPKLNFPHLDIPEPPPGFKWPENTQALAA